MKVLIINGSPVKNGATAAFASLIAQASPVQHQVRIICIDDYEIGFCRGCRACYTTAACVLEDGAAQILQQFEQADSIVVVAPSYWADIPGQLKAFIDRCTPYCNTHQPHASVGKGKRGFVAALRTGSNPRECERIIENLQHFYGHMEIEASGSFYLCGIDTKQDIMANAQQIRQFADAYIYAD